MAERKKVKAEIHGAESPDDWDRLRKPPVEAWAILCFPGCSDAAYIAFGERMFRTRDRCAAYIKAVCNNGERPIKVEIVPIPTRRRAGK